MKIIAGQFKGRRLQTPKDKKIRPTSSRVREFIFSCLGNRVENARVLDLFAGTGGLGIEALSRGAEIVVFNDYSGRSLDIVRANVKNIGCTAGFFKMPAHKFIKYAVDNEFFFDIVFCDPPYGFSRFDAVLDALVPVLHQSVVVYESSARQKMIQSNNYQIDKTKSLGDTQITFYRFYGQK